MSRIGLCALSVLVLAACAGGGADGTDDSPTNTAGVGNTPSFGGASGSNGLPSGGSSNSTAGAPASGGGAPPEPTPAFNLECSAPKLGAPVMRLLTRSELENSLKDIFPEVASDWTNSLPANNVSAHGFDNSASATVGNQLAGALLDTAETVGAALAAKANSLLPCSATGDAACAGQFLDKYGRRLFRRPLSAAEKTSYLDYFESVRSKSDFATGLKWMAAGLIQSPHAVYRREIGTPSGDTRQLTPHEIATEIAYTYTGTTPTEDLLAKADAGDIGDPVALAKTLVNTDRGKQVLHRYFEGYLGYASVAAKQKPYLKEVGPKFAEVNADMARETRTFIEEVLYQKKGGLKELLTSTSTNPSSKLAQYYSFPAPSSDFTSVQRPAGKGIGVLAQGAFLATHANSDGSSPTQRGNFVYLRLLCGPKLEVPPNIPQLGPPEETTTTRQRYENVHTKAGTSCPGCHQRFDPIGFGFEHYDEGGRFRERENELPIDSSATVLSPEGEKLFDIDTQEELVTNLASLPRAQQCFAAYLATYAFGSNEACLGSSNVTKAQAGMIGVVDAYAELASEPHFTKRRAQ